MKKYIAIFMSLLVGSAFLTGCSDSGDSFESKSYTANAGEASAVNIDVKDREIEVLLSEDDQIHIDYSESDKEYYSISVSDDNVLTMTSVNDKEWTDYIGKKTASENRKISLKLPDELLASLELSTTNENISVCAISVTDSISIYTNGGDINFDELNVVNDLKLETKNGNIDGTITGGYDDYSIYCKIKKGETNLPERKESGDKALNIKVNNGNAEIDFSAK